MKVADHLLRNGVARQDFHLCRQIAGRTVRGQGRAVAADYIAREQIEKQLGIGRVCLGQRETDSQREREDRGGHDQHDPVTCAQDDQKLNEAHEPYP
jgi:hypothetical protein